MPVIVPRTARARTSADGHPRVPSQVREVTHMQAADARGEGKGDLAAD